MSAIEKITSLADPALAAALNNILPELLKPDSAGIQTATNEFRKLSSQEAFVPTLTQIILGNETDASSRQLAAVLFRKRVVKSWKTYSPDMQSTVRQASLEYLSSADKAIFKHMAEVVAGISEFEIKNDGWADLWSLIQNTTTSGDYETRLKGTELLAVVCKASFEPILENDQICMSVCQLISELIKADDVNAGDKNLGQNVHKNIIDAFNAIVPFFEEKHVSVARQILPRMITVVGELCKWDDSVGSDALSMFSELCEIEEANLVNLEITKFMAEVSLQICLVPDYEEETRANGLAQLQMLIKYKKKAFTKFKLVEPLINEMLGLVVNEEDPDDGIMSGGDSGERTVYTGALQVLDQLAMHVGAEKIIGSCAPRISQLLSDAAPNSQRAGLLILSVIVEGCGDLIQASYLDQLVPAVCQHMQNPGEKVRSAAYFTIGQFAEHLVPDINDYADNIMPQLMHVLENQNSNPELQNRDVLTKVYYAMETLIESLGSKPNGMDQYTNTLMQMLVGTLHNGNSSVYIQECIVGTIGACAAAVEKKFEPYLAQTLEIMQKFFPTEESINKLEEAFAKAEEEGGEQPEDLTNLWGRSLNTLSSICRAVGAELFEPYAQTTLEMAITLSSSSDDPDIKGSAFSLFGALGAIMKDRMQPHMEAIYEILGMTLDEPVLNFEGDQNDESRVKEMAQMLEISKDYDGQKDGEEEDDIADLANCNIETGPIEAKIAAMETVGELAEMCPAAFAPYMEETYNKAIEISQFEGCMHEEIARAALSTALIMSAELFKHHEAAKNEEGTHNAVELAKAVWPAVIDSIKSSQERSVCMSLLYHLEKSIQINGQVMFTDMTMLESVMTAVITVLQDKASCQTCDEEEVAEDEFEDAAEHDQLLIEYACDILPTTCIAIGGKKFVDVWKGFFPVLKKRAMNKRAGTTRAAALGAMADIMKAAASDGTGEQLACQHAGELIPIYLECMGQNIKENNVRNNAVYGLGLLVSLGVNSCAAQLGNILEQLWAVMQREKADNVKDQVLGAVARICISIEACEQVNLPIQPVLQGLCQGLPVKQDPSELAPVVTCAEKYLQHLSDEQILIVLKNCAVMSQEYGSNFDDMVKVSITRLMKKLQESGKTGAMNQLSGEEQAAIQEVLVQ
jgi:hypothetical protein